MEYIGRRFRAWLAAALLPACAVAQSNAPDLGLLQEQNRIKKESEEKIQRDVLDPILGKNQAVAFVDVEMEVKVEREQSMRSGMGLAEKYREKAGAGSKSGMQTTFVLPGIPKPKTIAAGDDPGAARVRAGAAGAAGPRCPGGALRGQARFQTLGRDRDPRRRGAAREGAGRPCARAHRGRHGALPARPGPGVLPADPLQPPEGRLARGPQEARGLPPAALRPAPAALPALLVRPALALFPAVRAGLEGAAGRRGERRIEDRAAGRRGGRRG